MHKVIVSTIGIVVLASLTLLAGPAQAFSPTCESSVSYEIDNIGNVVLFPVAQCTGPTKLITIRTYNPGPGPSETATYENKPGGVYPGYGVTLPNTGHGTYCISVVITWAWLAGTDDASSKNCVSI